MASNKSDVRRPLCCAADDDAFPLPDYLIPIADRLPVDIQDFVNTPIPSPPTIPPSDVITCGKEEAEQAQSGVAGECQHVPRTAIAAALQTVPRVSPPDPIPPPPTLSSLLQQQQQITQSTHSSNDTNDTNETSDSVEGSQVIINITIYNSQSPTKSAQLSLPATTPLITLINAIPCTARPNLINTPSTALFYIGNTLYQRTPPRQANYAAPIQTFLRKYSSTQPPRLESITTTFPTLLHLTLTLGLPYPFLHHADCEHLMIFTDIFHTHQQNPTPTIHHRPPRVTPCDVCRRRAADRFTIADPLADASPFHYCCNCFRTAHYSHDGQLFDRAADFRLYSHYSPI